MMRTPPRIALPLAALASAALLSPACGKDDDGGGGESIEDVADAGGDGAGGDGAGGDGANGETDAAPQVVDVTARFDPAGEDFYALPWPNDYRLFDDGTVDLSLFPRAENGLIRSYRGAIEHVIGGFATMPVVYFALDQAVPDSAIPDPVATLENTAPIQLIELDSGECGRRIPILADIDEEGDHFIEPNTLTITPVEGYVLRPSTTYAAVILDSFGADDGFAMQMPDGFQGIPDGDHANRRLNDVYAPLRESAECARLDLARVMVATVFTTQDPLFEMRALAEASLDPDVTPAPVVRDWTLLEDYSEEDYTTYQGWYDTPIYMEGTSPYTSAGGAFRFDEDGVPIIQGTEGVPFVITFPTDATSPLPVLVWEDGTGWGQWGHIPDRQIQAMLDGGVAVAAFMPQFHGERAVPGSDEEINTFNYTNPVAGRTVIRQEAADVSYFIRVIREATEGLEGLPALDGARLLYGGHSQGSQVGALVAGVEDQFLCYMFSGVSAYLTMTILDRKDYLDIEAMVAGLLDIPRDLSRFHPVVQMAQLGAEVVDPHNYAPAWAGWEEHPAGNHVFMINGREDDTTSPVGQDALFIAGGVDAVDPSGWTADGGGVFRQLDIAPPFSGNRESIDGTPLTLAGYLNLDTGHFTMYEERRPRDMAVGFWLSGLEGTPEVIDP